MSQLANNVALEQSFNVYLKRAGTFDRFEYAGQRARLDTQTENDGGLNTTTKFAIGGGVERDGITQDVPGTTDFGLIMKRIVNDQKKTELRRCFFHVDHRLHCGNGADRDDPFAWKEIDRYAWSKGSGREKSQGSWEAETEAMVTIPRQALESYDLYRTSLGVIDSSALSAITAAASITAVATGEPAGCGTCTNPSGDAIVYAVTTLVVAGTPYLFINNKSGELDQWTEVALTGWSTAGADDVWARGKMVVIVSNGESAVKRSDDQGVNQADIALGSAPNCIDGLHQGLIVIGADGGDVYGSYDGGRTWELLNTGSASTTTENILNIQIDRSNPNIMYASCANGELIKTENGGETWFAITTPTAQDILAMWVEDGEHVLLYDDANVLYETSDGGATWTAQNTLPNSPTVPTSAEIVRVGADVYYMAITSGTESVVLKNVDGGANGYWYLPENGDAFTASQDTGRIAALDVNRAVTGGGDGTTSSTFGLITS